MSRLISTLSVGLIVAFVTEAGAETVLESPGEKALKAWADVFVGEWQSDAEIAFEWPGAEIGDKLEVRSIIRKTDDGMHYEGVWRGTINGRLFESARTIYGWDASRKCVREHWFSARGGTGGSYITQISRKRWLHTSFSISPEGVAGTSTTVVEVDDDNTHIIRTTNSVQGGKALPTTTDVVTRVTNE